MAPRAAPIRRGPRRRGAWRRDLSAGPSKTFDVVDGEERCAGASPRPGEQSSAPLNSSAPPRGTAARRDACSRGAGDTPVPVAPALYMRIHCSLLGVMPLGRNMTATEQQPARAFALASCFGRPASSARPTQFAAMVLPRLAGEAVLPAPLWVISVASLLPERAAPGTGRLDRGCDSGPAVGLRAPAFEAAATHRPIMPELRPQLLPGLIAGVLGGPLLFVSLRFLPAALAGLQQRYNPPRITGSCMADSRKRCCCAGASCRRSRGWHGDFSSVGRER